MTLLNAIYCLAELLEFAAFVWLRIKQPHLLRPYRCVRPTVAGGGALLGEVGVDGGGG